MTAFEIPRKAKLYWGKDITTTYARMDDILNRVGKLIVFVLLFFSIVGKGAIVLFIYNAFLYTNFPLQELFFGTLNFNILLFWISVVVDMFLYYRLTITVERKKDLQEAIKRATEKNEKLDVSLYYTTSALKVVERSWEIVTKYKQDGVLPFHFFIILLDSPDIREIFSRLNINYQTITEILARQIKKHELPDGSQKKVVVTSIAQDVLLHSGRLSISEHKKQIDEISLFQAIVEKGNLVKEILYELDIEDEKIRNTVSWIRARKEIFTAYRRTRFRSRLKPSSQIDRAMTGLSTPYVSRMSTDLTLMAKNGMFAPYIDRGNVLDEVFQGLESQKNVLLMGETGVGKTAIIEGLASRMAAEEVPTFLKDKRLVKINASRLIAGAGAAESVQKLITLFDEVTRAGNVALVIEHINRFVGISTGSAQSLDIADVIGTLLGKKRVYIIGTAEPTTYQYGKRTTTLSQIFRVLSIEEPSENETIRILASKTLLLEAKYHVFFTYNAIEELYNISARFMPKEHLPKKAVNLLDEIAVAKKGTKKETQIIKKNDIAEILSKKIHIPLTDIGEGEREKLLNLEKLLHKKIISQNAAVDAVANALRRARTDLKRTERPIANLLFLGPTGVGKTALAKAVSEIYFGASYHMTRLDMNEFQTKDSLQTLIGSNGETGILTRSIEEHPFGLLLLDEIEKADKDVINVFLQLMDEGHITDGRGLRIDATHILLVATSNAGSQFIQDKLRAGEKVEKITKELSETQLKHYFLPEFLNRFDEIIVFKTLNIADVEAITDLFLQDISKRMEESHGIFFTVEKDARSYIATEGYKEEYGARQLHRTIQHIIEDPISKILLTKRAKRRDTIRVSGKGIFTIEKAEAL